MVALDVRFPTSIIHVGACDDVLCFVSGRCESMKPGRFYAFYGYKKETGIYLPLPGGP